MKQVEEIVVEKKSNNNNNKNKKKKKKEWQTEWREREKFMQTCSRHFFTPTCPVASLCKSFFFVK